MSIAQAIRTFSESQPDLPEDLPVDINFWFFLSIYYGAYLAVALIWVTCLFNLYRREFSLMSKHPHLLTVTHSELVAQEARRSSFVRYLLGWLTRCRSHHPLCGSVRHGAETEGSHGAKPRG